MFGLNSILWIDKLTKKANHKSHRGFKRRGLHKMFELYCWLSQQSTSHYRSFSSNENIWPQRNKVEPVVMIANWSGFLHCSSAMFTGCSYFIIDLSTLEKTNEFLGKHGSMLHTNAYYFFFLDITTKENARIQSWTLFKYKFFTKENRINRSHSFKWTLLGFKCCPISTSIQYQFPCILQEINWDHSKISSQFLEWKKLSL